MPDILTGRFSMPVPLHPHVEIDWTVYPHVLQLSTRAFATSHDGVVARQMRRIRKYIQRGFRFPHRNVWSGAELKDILQNTDDNINLPTDRRRAPSP